MSSPNEQQKMKNTQKTLALRNGHPMLCPKCKKQLFLASSHDVEIDICEACQGIWVDYINEKTLLDLKPEVFTLDELKRLRKLYKPLDKPVIDSGYSPCPVCNQLMQKRNWGSYSGVIVDKCMTHGTWYDAGELDKIKEFIALGGIEFEKMQIDSDGITEVDQKLFRKVNELHKEINSAYARARFYNILGL